MKGIRNAGGALLLGLAWSASAPAATLITGVDDSGGSRVRVFGDIDPLTPAADFLAFDAAFRGGVRVAAGDVNGDGTADRIVAAGAGGGPRVRVFSGADDSPLADFLAFDANFSGGLTVAAGDVNGDGRADIVVGTGSGSSRVRVFSATSTAQPLLDFFAFDAQYSGGIDVAAGDFNGNGRADILVAPSGAFAPVVDFFDGQTGTAFNRLFPLGQQHQGGINVAVGDVNGDGSDDLVAAASGNAGPRVVAINTVSQQAIVDFLAFDPAFRGGVRIAAGDLDDDGRADLVAGAGPGGSARVRVFSGADTGRVLADFFAYDSTGYTGGVFVDASRLPAASARAGQLQFSSTGYTQAEAGTQAIITVRRVGGSAGAASVAYTAAAGTAGSADFTAVSGTLDWQDGDAADRVFQVPITDDALDDNDETVALRLNDATGATLGQPATATLTIVDDDDPPPPPQLALDAGSYQVDEAAGTLTVTVRRIGDSSAAARAQLRTASGTAVAGSDFTAVDATLDWQAGDATPRTVRIAITDDILFEAGEAFTVQLQVLSGGTLSGPGTATVTLNSDEALASAVFGQPEYTVAEAGGTVTLVVRRIGETRTRVQLTYRSFSGSADAAEPVLDYTATSGVLVFEPGVTELRITVAILGDTALEADERFSVLLENPSSGLDIPQTRGRVMILDDDQPPPDDDQPFFIGALNPLLLLPLLAAAAWRRRRSPGGLR